jgi:hypothetical protein
MAWISSFTSTVLPTPAPPNTAALRQWRQQVDDLDAGRKNFRRGGLR